MRTRKTRLSNVGRFAGGVVLGALVTVVGYVLMDKGVTRMKASILAPTRTMDSLKETATWTSKTRA